MSQPPGPHTTLEHYPWVVVRFRCKRCRRYADARIARLAEKFGAGETMAGLLDRFIATCNCIARRKDGLAMLDQLPCGGYCPDLGSTLPPDLPPMMRAFGLIEGGKPDMLPAEAAPNEWRKRIGEG